MYRPIRSCTANRSKGFTLIELMITVAIIGILASIAYPAYTSQIAKGKRAECRAGLMQAMQQQERYFSQYNTYWATSSGTAAPVKTVSGDNPSTSACTMNHATCPATGRTAITQCVEIQATFNVVYSNITQLTLDSDNNKGCSISGTRQTTANTTCWP